MANQPDEPDDMLYGSDDEEYYDALNDETFGDCGDFRNGYSWEESHLESTSWIKGGDGSVNLADDSVREGTERRAVYDDSFDDDFLFDKSLEAQIVRLVVGDSEEEDFRDELSSKNSEGRMENAEKFASETARLGSLNPERPIQTPTGNAKTNLPIVKIGLPIPKEAKTLTEIEEELFQGCITTFPPAKATPPCSIQHSKPKVLMLEDLEREYLQDAVSLLSAVPIPASNLAPTANHLPQANPFISESSLFRRAHLPRGYTNLDSTVNSLNACTCSKFMSMPHTQQRMAFPRPPFPPPYYLHIPPPPGFPVRRFVPPPPYEFHNMMTPILPSPPPYLQSTNAKKNLHFLPPPPSIIPRCEDSLLMTKEEKQKLIKIQIYQLHSTHPHSTDYYNLMRHVKQADLPGRRHLLFLKLFPKKREDAAQPVPETRKEKEYIPPRFNNCLGQLQVASTLTPRRVIDAGVVVSLPESYAVPWKQVGNRKTFRMRHLLLEIENLYESLLVMEECRIRGSILCDSEIDKEEFKRQSNEASGKIEKTLSKTHKLLKILSVSKGKMLVCRALPLIDSSKMYKLFAQLLQLFPLWAKDPEVEQKVFPYLKHCILETYEIKDLITLIGGAGVTVGLIDNNQDMFKSLVKSKLGVTLLLCIFHQAEYLLTTKCDPLLFPDIELLWTRKSMAGITAILEQKDELPTPIDFYPSIMQHICRFPFQRNEVQIIKSIFQQWWASR